LRSNASPRSCQSACDPSLSSARRDPIHTPLRPRARFRTLLSVACCTTLGAAPLAGAGTATATEPGDSTAYAKCGSDWWSYDTPRTIKGKMKFKDAQRLGGTFFWELSGDTTDGELINPIN
jgi:hypothetical protein